MALQIKWLTKEGQEIVRNPSLRHDVFRPYYAPGVLYQHGLGDSLKAGDIIIGPDLHSMNPFNTTLYKITPDDQFNEIDKTKNKPTRTDIKIRTWALFKYQSYIPLYI